MQCNVLYQQIRVKGYVYNNDVSIVLTAKNMLQHCITRQNDFVCELVETHT